MAANELIEVYRQLRISQHKYTYFMLAAAASAVAFAVTRTQDDVLAWSMLPLAGAVISWGASFFFGCRHLDYVNSTLYANYELLRVEKGIHREAGTHPNMIAAASEGIRKAIEANSNRANRLGKWQFRMLTVGALFYLSWHILEMYIRTFP